MLSLSLSLLATSLPFFVYAVVMDPKQKENKETERETADDDQGKIRPVTGQTARQLHLDIHVVALHSNTLADMISRTSNSSVVAFHENSVRVDNSHRYSSLTAS